MMAKRPSPFFDPFNLKLRNTIGDGGGIYQHKPEKSVGIPIPEKNTFRDEGSTAL